MDAPAKQRRFETLPEPVDLQTTITSKESNPVPDPEGDRNTDHDFMLRYGSG